MALGIGKRIKERRIALGMTQEELAKKMGYSTRQAISKVEKGDDNITSDRVKKFADALDVSVSYIMGWDEEQLNAIEEERKDVVDYIVKQDEKLNEIFEINLSENNMDELIRYAKYLKSLEKKEGNKNEND